MKLSGPVLWRNLGILVLVAGPACLAVAVEYGRKDEKMSGSSGWAYSELCWAWWAALVVYNTYEFARDYQRLARGQDVIARWHVDAAQWQAFVADD
jgi:hypothetical protein